jgi:hypothetical protein
MFWLGKKAKRGIEEKILEPIARIEKIQTVQAENHLQTIQANTAKTVEVLEKMVVAQAETNGFLRGIVEGHKL